MFFVFDNQISLQSYYFFLIYAIAKWVFLCAKWKKMRKISKKNEKICRYDKIFVILHEFF